MLLYQQAQACGDGSQGFPEPPSPTAQDSLLPITQKPLGAPAPFVAVLPQGLVILLQPGEHVIQSPEFRLDSGKPGKQRGLLRLRCR